MDGQEMVEQKGTDGQMARQTTRKHNVSTACCWQRHQNIPTKHAGKSRGVEREITHPFDLLKIFFYYEHQTITEYS